MKKVLSTLSLTLILIFVSCILIGCGDKEYKVTFMSAVNILYSDNLGISCVYRSKDEGVIFVKEGEVIGASPVNTTYGTGNYFKFVGWYTEEECLNQWDLYRDEVRSNLTLYPKYIKV